MLHETNGERYEERYPSGWEEKSSRLAFIFLNFDTKREAMTLKLMENRKLKTFSLFEKPDGEEHSINEIVSILFTIRNQERAACQFLQGPFRSIKQRKTLL